MGFGKKKNLLKKFFLSQIFITVLGLIVIFLISFPLAKKVSKQYKVNKEIEDLKNEIAEVESKNSDLKKLLTYLDSDQYVEEQAREKLNYKKEGEEVVVIKNNLEEKTQLKNSSLESENVYNVKKINNTSLNKKQYNYQKWLKYFFKY